jgi:hypothetical protein
MILLKLLATIGCFIGFLIFAHFGKITTKINDNNFDIMLLAYAVAFLQLLAIVLIWI